MFAFASLGPLTRKRCFASKLSVLVSQRSCQSSTPHLMSRTMRAMANRSQLGCSPHWSKSMSIIQNIANRFSTAYRERRFFSCPRTDRTFWEEAKASSSFRPHSELLGVTTPISGSSGLKLARAAEANQQHYG